MKLVTKIVFTSVVLAVITVAALPTLLSRKSFQPAVVEHLNSYIPGRIEIENYSLSWFGGIHIEKFTLRDADDAIVAEFEKFSTDSSLFAVLFNSQFDKKTDILALNLNIIKEPSGKTNLEESLGADLLLDLPSPLVLTDMQLQYYPKSDQQFTAKLSGITKQENLKGSFDIEMAVKDENLHVKADIKDFPVGILDALATSKNPDLFGMLPKLLGKSLNISVDKSMVNDHFELKLVGNSQSKPISWAATVNFDQPKSVDNLTTLLTAMNSYNIQIKEVPAALLDEIYGEGERFQNTFGDLISVSLQGTGADFSKFSVGIFSDNIEVPEVVVTLNDISQENLSGSFSIGKLIFIDEGKKHLLSDLHIVWAYNGVKRDFSANLNGNVAEAGKINGKVKYIDDESRINAFLQGKQVPAHFFEIFSGQNVFAPIFGHLIDTEIEVDTNGTHGYANVDLKGNNGYLVFKGLITDNMLTLKAPLYLQTQPSEQLGRELFREYLPPLGELLTGDSPMSILIDPEGFVVPVSDFDINMVKIKKAKLELGKLIFRNKGEVKKIAKFLNANSNDNVSIWFTPQYFSVDDGLVEISRTDFLLMDRYPLAFWGKIDLARDYIDATLGISDRALENAFNVKGLAANSLLQIPVKGKLDKPKVDTSMAIARIGSLAAKQKGSPEGLLIGTVLDIANGSSREKTPAPTTNPLPWADQMKSSSVSETDSSKKGIEAQAKDILKGIFKK